MTVWDEFTDMLSLDLSALHNGDTVVWTSDGRVVQFRQHPDLLRASVVSNEFLPDQRKLSTDDERALTAAGWTAPSGPSDPNWTFDLSWPAATEGYRALARNIGAVITDILNVDSPDQLATRAWNNIDPQRHVAIRCVELAE